MRASLLLLAAALLMPVSVSSADAHMPRSAAKHTWRKLRLQPCPDCVPFNGPFGYYGNLWCSPASIRPPNTDFGERRWLPAR